VADEVFFVTQVGSEGSPERARADEVSDFILAPVAAEFDLTVHRADRDPTPGQITSQVVRRLLDARLVVADLTGRNPNVYYELGVAHAFKRPVILLADSIARSVSFDVQNEKTITIGDDGRIGVSQAEDAKRRLRGAFEVVLDRDYEPENVITAAASAQSLDELAPSNPLASEISALRDAVEEERRLLVEISSLMRLREGVPRRKEDQRRRTGSPIDAFSTVELVKLVAPLTSAQLDELVSELEPSDVFRIRQARQIADDEQVASNTDRQADTP
jgi:hypothetical protein